MIISFTILYDLKNIEKEDDEETFPIHREIQGTKEEIKKFVIEMMQKYVVKYIHEGLVNQILRNEIPGVVNDLMKYKFAAWRRLEKYYCICFALDYTKYYVWSKYQDKKIIDWGFEGEFVDDLGDNDNYNENPVITLMKNLGLKN